MSCITFNSLKQEIVVKLTYVIVHEVQGSRPNVFHFYSSNYSIKLTWSNVKENNYNIQTTVKIGHRLCDRKDFQIK